jgi:hypothetical protein
MTLTSLLVVSAIASAFLLFGVVLASVDFYSSDASNDHEATSEPTTRSAMGVEIEHRKAA